MMEAAASPSSPASSIYETFTAAVRCVGTACTLAAVGVYLHRRGFLAAGEGKRALALISQQVTFPLFLFTKIIFCNQDWSDKPCPDVTKSLGDVWMLLWWPIVVVGSGILIGYLVACVCETPKNQVRAVLVACGFGNSTGLPITILTVIHANFPETSDLGRIDPTLFLSVYLLLYPVLQWGIGGWLLAPEETEHVDHEESNEGEAENHEDMVVVDQQVPNNADQGPSSSRSHHHRRMSSLGDTLRHNVLNNRELADIYVSQRHGLTSNDEGMYMSEINLASLGEVSDGENPTASIGENAGADRDDSSTGMPQGDDTEETPLVSQQPLNGYYGIVPYPPPPTAGFPPPLSAPKRELSDSKYYDVDNVCEACKNVMSRCFQPPVVGAILGIIVAAIEPLRGVFVDLEDRASHAPLQWLFDGLYSVGLAAVPINMMILGCNLSASQMTFAKAREVNGLTDALLPWKTMVGIVVGKMIVQPAFGILLCFVLRTYFWDIPDEIDGSFYLVLMIVFLTPTANNVMVMVELSGSGAKEGIAAVIAMQYAVAPLILSLTMTVAVGFASNWS